MSSAFWMFIIVIAALFLAFANIQYPIAKQAEEKRSMVITLEETLKPELESNLEIANNLKANLSREPQSIPFEHFDINAWEIVSNGTLLLGLDSKKRESLIKAYVLINKANEYHAKILESTTGITSALGGISETRKKLVNLLVDTLDKLIPLLNSLTSNKLS